MTTWKVTVILRPFDARYSDGERVCASDMAGKLLVRTDDVAAPDDAITQVEYLIAMMWPSLDLVRAVSCVVVERGGEMLPA